MPAAQAPDKSEAALHFSLNPVLERAQSQWLFTPTELQRVPSILDGMDIIQEQSNHSKGVNLITQVGMLLKLPQLTLATASVYLHCFFMRHFMVDLPN
jgi:protein BUR2